MSDESLGSHHVPLDPVRFERIWRYNREDPNQNGTWEVTVSAIH